MLEKLSELLTQFHFTQPFWLVALLPLMFFYWLIRQKKASGSGWNKVIDAHLLPVLIKNNPSKVGKSFSMLLMVAWLMSVLALANPTWEKQIMPVFQTNTARVIVLDLSRSMEIADITPSRLTRARFKVEDILAKDEEGQTGLVVFAGDAFTVTPLTRDADTIRSLLKSLTPSIMPIQGSRADLGLLKAGELLEQAGVQHAQIIVIADGAEAPAAFDAADKLNKKGHTVSVLSVGTKNGAPIPKVRDGDGKPIIVGMEEEVLKEIATIGGGRYRSLSSNSADIDDLLSLSKLGGGDKIDKNNDLQSTDWKSEGPWLVLLILPLAALAFRRGWLLSVGLVVIILGQPKPALASVWDSLWMRQDQQADLAFEAGDYEQAQQLSEAPLRRGSAAYKQGDFEQALNDFAQVESADGAYNKGNALAKLNKFEEAIKAYDQALKQQPDMQDAKENKAHIEALLKKQQEQKKQDQQQDKNQEQKDSEDQENKDNKDQQDQQDSESKDKNEGQSSDKEKSGKDKDKESEESKENQFANANDPEKKNEEEKSDVEKSDVEKSQEEKQKEQDAEQQEKKDGKESEEQQQIAKAAEDKEKKEGKGGKEGNEESETDKATASAEELSKEEKVAAEQWLRRIPDDPGGLLKRKFKYQYKRRGQRAGTGGQRPW